MAAPSKTKKIESLAKLLQKRFKGLPEPPERAVLEHLIYAALLENATFEQADSAMSVLEHHFIDWNEVRVSTVGELADVFSMLPVPHAAGERVRYALQGIFEKTYLFDLEDLRKKGKNLSQSVTFLESVYACSRFMIDYATQFAFGGHVVPVDEASLRVFRLLGLTQVNKEGTREEVPGLERAIAKKNGPAFSIQLHAFAAGFFNDPESTELRTILKSIDPEAVDRDWTPPVLTIPKAPTKPTAKTPQAAPAPLPFVAPDDDDFEDDHDGTEAEFISEDDESVDRPAARGRDHLPSVETEEPKKAKKQKKEKTEKKSIATEANESPAAKETPKKSAKKPTKKVGEKSTGPSKPASEEKKSDGKKIPTKTTEKNEDKSPTRKLRENKPK